MMMQLTDPVIWANLITLTVLEIVLGIDNLVFITLVTNQLPEAKQRIARRLGLLLAMGMRLILLALASWLASLTTPLFEIFHYSMSTRDLIFIVGGAFLIIKAIQELKASIMLEEQHEHRGTPLFSIVLLQIMFFDIIFSLDSVITAVGLSQHYWIMAMAIIIAIMVMLLASDITSDLITRYPNLKVLALSFLILVGGVLILDGLSCHISRMYLYVAMGFSVFVEILNIMVERANNSQ